MISLGSTYLLFEKEVRDARRSRWFVLFAALFAGLALSLSWLGLSGLGSYGLSGFARTSASLVNLVVLIVPLMGLLLGALSVAGEREQGTLLTLLYQPVTSVEILVAKWLALATALTATILIGFGLSGVVISRHAGTESIGAYLSLVGWTVLLGLAHLSIGVAISIRARRTVTAVGAAIALWLAVVFFSDLGLMGTAMVLDLSPSSLLWLSLANPAQVFRIGVLAAIEGNLESLGPAGLYARDVLGDRIALTLGAWLAAWAAVPLVASLVLFRRRNAP